MIKLKDFEANVEGYHFRVDIDSLADGIGSEGEYLSPIRGLSVGINEEENKIAYLYHWDIELHEMNDLDSFIENNFVLE